jgi:hypothetical protein
MNKKPRIPTKAEKRELEIHTAILNFFRESPQCIPSETPTENPGRDRRRVNETRVPGCEKPGRWRMKRPHLENLAFTRLLLKGTMEVIKPLTTVAERKGAWVYHLMGDDWEFHGPNEFYWYGDADNAYHARQQGWEAWREQLLRDHDKDETQS